MTIDILSDLHIDFYFRHYITPEAVESIYAHIFTDNGRRNVGDVIVIAGDLGHYNNQNIEVLKLIKEVFKYRHIICVLGNHDYYLIDNTSKKEFVNESLERVKHMRSLINEQNGMYCLNGDVIEIDGVKIGGCDSWYDGEYIKKHFKDQVWNIKKDDSYIESLWRRKMIDDGHIYGINRQYLADLEKEKIEKIYKDVDVMVTHVNPSLDKEHTDKKFREQETTGFFTFDGSKYLKEGSMKYWVFGHSHINAEFEVHGVQCISNQMGYPSESDYGDLTRIKSISIRKNT